MDVGLALCAHRDIGDLAANSLFQILHIIAGLLGQVLPLAGCGQFIGDNKEKASFLFWIVNVWILILMPISCIFNFLQGIKFGHWWTFTPIPQLGNSIVSYVLCWGFYLIFCIVVDFLLIKHSKR